MPFQLSGGPGRKVVYARARDENGQTFVTWDSIYLGEAPAAVDATREAIRRIRHVRLPPLDRPGFESFAYSLGAYREAEDMPVWWGHREVVADPDATGGHALELFHVDEGVGLANAQTGPRDVPVGDGDIWFRVKAPASAHEGLVAAVSFREDTGGPVGSRLINAADFRAPGRYEWFRLPYRRHLPTSIFYIEMETHQAGARIDRWEIWSRPAPTAATREGVGITLDFEHVNYRGVELKIRFLNGDAFVEGPRINPYCSICAP